MVWYDVDGGYSRLLIERNVVVVHHRAVGHREIFGVADAVGGSPHLVHDVLGIALRYSLLMEARALSAHHVEQNAVCRRVALGQMGSPVLRSESPGVVVRRCVFPLGRSPVLRVEAHEVYAQPERTVVLEQPCQLKHHSDTARSVVGSHDRLAPVGGVGVVVCPRTRVPVCADDYPFLRFRVVAGYDVAAAQGCPVISFEVGALPFHLHSVCLELARYPFSALVVRLAVHCPRTERALFSHETVCRVSVELRTCECHGVCRSVA